jgi:hypothetical protein
MENVRVYTYGDILCSSHFNEFKWDAAILYVSTLRNAGASSIHDITLYICTKVPDCNLLNLYLTRAGIKFVI